MSDALLLDPTSSGPDIVSSDTYPWYGPSVGFLQCMDTMISREVLSNISGHWYQ